MKPSRFWSNTAPTLYTTRGAMTATKATRYFAMDFWPLCQLANSQRVTAKASATKNAKARKPCRSPPNRSARKNTEAASP